MEYSQSWWEAEKGGGGTKTTKINPKKESWEGSGGVLEGSWGVLRRLVGGVGRPRCILDASWVRLGCVLWVSGGVLGASLGLLGGSWGHLGAILERLRGSWEGPGGVLEVSRELFSASWGGF